jgi:hypothetical protein
MSHAPLKPFVPPANAHGRAAVAGFSRVREVLRTLAIWPSAGAPRRLGRWDCEASRRVRQGMHTILPGGDHWRVAKAMGRVVPSSA